MKTLCIVGVVIGFALVACTRSSSVAEPRVTIESLNNLSEPTVIVPTATLPAVLPTPFVGYSEIANSSGFCHLPQYFGEGTPFWESKNVCIVRGAASGLLQARIQATTIIDYNARKAFAERKLVGFVEDGTLTSTEVCDASYRTGLFTEQADLGGRGDIRLTTAASKAIGCGK